MYRLDIYLTLNCLLVGAEFVKKNVKDHLKPYTGWLMDFGNVAAWGLMYTSLEWWILWRSKVYGFWILEFFTSWILLFVCEFPNCLVLEENSVSYFGVLMGLGRMLVWVLFLLCVVIFRCGYRWGIFYCVVDLCCYCLLSGSIWCCGDMLEGLHCWNDLWPSSYNY